jgi:glycosyltransferase involved in cell wall biosynthesis
MKIDQIVDVIIPAFNEEKSIGKVIGDIPSYVRNVIVVNNGSTDKTSLKAKNAGAIVLEESRKGYGSACLCGIEFLKREAYPPNILVFLDGDYSDFPEQMDRLLSQVQNYGFDLVLGSRELGNRSRGSMTIPQIFGNKLATFLMEKIYKFKFTDLGPFRAIVWEKLISLNMADRNYGWTIEMQIKAIQQNLKITEVPVDYRERIGVSKVSGTVKGVIGAGYKILYTIWRYS